MAFQGGAYDRVLLHVANTDGSDLVTLPVDQSGIYNLGPAWNTEGTKLYFGGSKVSSVNPDGTGQAEVLPDVPGLSTAWLVSVSSDSHYIAVLGLMSRGRDVYMAELDQTSNPPRAKDWTNVTISEPGNWPSNSNVGFGFRPQNGDPTHPCLLVRGQSDSCWYSLRVEDRGAPPDRFVATIDRLNLPGGAGARSMGFTFSPDGSELATVEWTGRPSAGLRRYLWDTTGSAPCLSGEKVVSSDGVAYRQLDWR
jgi:hypothetical protein